jgi:hypothetical protein
MKSLIFEWHLSSEEFADFLSKADPNWSRVTLVDMTSATIDDVVARLRGNWENELLAFDAVYKYVARISDALSGGTIERFPQQFPSRLTTAH